MDAETTLNEIQRLVFAIPRQGVTCPFCGESDFDQIGLKNHFMAGYCETFNVTPTVAEERAARAAKSV